MKNEMLQECIDMALKALDAEEIFMLSVHKSPGKESEEEVITTGFALKHPERFKRSATYGEIIENVMRSLNTMLDTMAGGELEVVIRAKQSGEVYDPPATHEGRRIYVERKQDGKPS